jgi:hypothetical protein
MQRRLVVTQMQMTDRDGSVLCEKDAVILDGRVVEMTDRGDIDEGKVQYLSHALDVPIQRVDVSMPEPASKQWMDVLKKAGLAPALSKFRMSCTFLNHNTGEFPVRNVRVSASSIEDAILKVKQVRGESLVSVNEAFCDELPVDLAGLKGCILRRPDLEDGYQLMPVPGASVWIQAGGTDIRVFDDDEGITIWASRHVEGDSEVQQIMTILHEDMVMPSHSPAEKDWTRPSGPRM